MSDAVSDLIVKASLGLLLIFSVVTWALVVLKALQHGRIRRQNASASQAIDRAQRLPAISELKDYQGPFARLAQTASLVFQEAPEGLSLGSEDIAVRRDFLERALRRQIQQERRGAEAGLAVLASIGTTSPFVGLFGTVWGIVHALRRITSFGSASLEVVAGPIGEALIATGIGIAVAVPAVLSYNYFVRRLKLFIGDAEDFASALLDAALRSLYAYDKEAPHSGRAARHSEIRNENNSHPTQEASA